MMHIVGKADFNNPMVIKEISNSKICRYGSKYGNRKLDLQYIPAGNHSFIQYEARKYLKALCRIYFADYLCLNYELPIECRPLLQELSTFVSEMKEFDRCSKRPESCK